MSLGIVGYLALRFEWRFAVAAIIANLHDVIIILGFFALFQWEFSLPVLAAVLAVLGYSVNESVVIADRIRENFRKMRKATRDARHRQRDHQHDLAHDHHARLTLMMVLSILFFGGETLHYFALALTIGICFGIYSSVLVMAPLVMWMGVSREDLVKPEQEARLGGEKILPVSAVDADRATSDRRHRRAHADDAASTRCWRSTRRSRSIAAQYGHWLYALLFLIIFAETGLVVFPFLPGDSILFIAGTVVATAGLNVHVLVVAADRRGDPRRHGQLLRSATTSGRRSSTGPIRAGSSRSTCAARRRSTTSTAASRSSSAASCRSSARSRRSSPASRA